MRRLTAIACALALAATTACAATREPAPSQAAALAEAPSLALARRVADWQLGHMDSFDYIGSFQRQTADGRDWIQAALFVGLTDLADAPGGERFAAAVERHGEREAWSYGARPRHADADAIGQVWIWGAGRVEGEARAQRLAATAARFDAVLADPSDAAMIFDEGPGERPCQVRWCWSDALFMGPATWTGLSRATGDPRYAAYGDQEFWATTDFLFDKQEGLFYRDSRYFDRRDDQGRKIFWSRGNGWVYAGIVDILKTLPANHPSRPRYEALFRQMSDRLISLQKTDGCWAPSLLAPEYAPPETSGTGFFVYGLAYGLNHGLLKGPKYEAAVAKGWSALANAVQPDGKLGWVQQIGYAPDHVEAADTQLYGVGAFLLAASEVGAR